MNTTDVELNGKKYLLMDSFEMDDLCTWIKDKREQVEERGTTNLLATLYGNKVHIRMQMTMNIYMNSYILKILLQD